MLPALPALGDAGVASGTLVNIEKSDSVSLSSPALRATLSKTGTLSVILFARIACVGWPVASRRLCRCFALVEWAGSLGRVG